jgi:uncharacterized iron-regulated membrane protein
MGVQMFADPADASVLGWRESGRLALDRRRLMDVLYGLHIDLRIAPWVTWAFGLVSLLWVFDHILSLVLAFPNARRWGEAFRINGRRGGLGRLCDLHSAPGLWAFPVTLVLAIIGVRLARPDDSRNLVATAAPDAAPQEPSDTRMAPNKDGRVSRIVEPAFTLSPVRAST